MCLWQGSLLWCQVTPEHGQLKTLYAYGFFRLTNLEGMAPYVKEDISRKKLLTFGHCPKVALTPDINNNAI